ncbi:hypothetical protein BM1_04267 [Bipolaris maydis]|nr:hypothetical protein BM1_04267 [Bipolaris maydis]
MAIIAQHAHSSIKEDNTLYLRHAYRHRSGRRQLAKGDGLVGVQQTSAYSAPRPQPWRQLPDD